MIQVQNLNSFTKDLCESIDGCVAVSFVELETGETLSSYTKDQSFDPIVASAYNSQVVKQKMVAKKALGMENKRIDEIDIIIEDQTHVIKLVDGNEYFVYIVVSNKGNNLGMIRLLLKQKLSMII